MAKELTTQDKPGTLENASLIEKVMIAGDLSGMSSAQRIEYYTAVCTACGLSPVTKPFEFIRLNQKLVLYARKEATEQLRKHYAASIRIVGREIIDGIYLITARAILPSGREDEATGAVSVKSLTGENKANAYMKAETKAKRRVTLSICGLGMLDEAEIPDDAKRSTYDTQETYQQIAERRMAEIREAGGTPSEDVKTAAKEPVRFPATPPEDLPEADGDVPDEVLAYWKRMARGSNRIASTCEVFAEIKQKINESQGSEADYYRILAECKMAHANDVKVVGIEVARQCVFLLWRHYQTVLAALQPPENEGSDVTKTEE